MNTQWKRNCPKCNRELYYAHKGNLTRSIRNNALCKKCFKSATTNEFVLRSQQEHGMRYDYSMVNYRNRKSKVKIMCANHGIFYQSPDAHLHGQGCPRCKGEKMTRENTSTTNEFLRKATLIHRKKYDYSLVDYTHCKTPVEIVCRKHGRFFQRPSDHLFGHGCPKCISIISEMEKEFLDFIRVPDTKENRQVLISRKKVDGLVGNTIYEFLGDYWHGNPNRFDVNGVNEICHQTYGKLYCQTLMRFERLNGLGYSVKYIWESDWKSWKKGKSASLPIQTYKENEL